MEGCRRPSLVTDLSAWTLYDINTAPRAFDIVLCRFPFQEDPSTPPDRGSPCLVRRVRVHKSGSAAFVEVAFGTTNLKTMSRMDKDLIIMNAAALNAMGLPRATRFDLYRTADLPWCKEWFPIPTRRHTPILGRLDDDHQKELAYLAMRITGRGETA